MKTLAQAIRITVEEAAAKIRTIDEEEFEFKPAENKWSKKEILGHLCDSALNNLQRFVRGQFEDRPKIIYYQDDWVRVQRYKDYNTGELIQLWVALNLHVCRTLEVMDPAHYERQCDTGKPSVELHTIQFIADDYLDHMNHHLKQIIG